VKGFDGREICVSVMFGEVTSKTDFNVFLRDIVFGELGSL